MLVVAAFLFLALAVAVCVILSMHWQIGMLRDDAEHWRSMYQKESEHHQRWMKDLIGNTDELNEED